MPLVLTFSFWVLFFVSNYPFSLIYLYVDLRLFINLSFWLHQIVIRWTKIENALMNVMKSDTLSCDITYRYYYHFFIVHSFSNISQPHFHRKLHDKGNGWEPDDFLWQMECRRLQTYRSLTERKNSKITCNITLSEALLSVVHQWFWVSIVLPIISFV